MVVRWQRLRAPSAAGLGSSPGQGTKDSTRRNKYQRPYMLQLRPGTTKIMQINIRKKKKTLDSTGTQLLRSNTVRSTQRSKVKLAGGRQWVLPLWAKAMSYRGVYLRSSDKARHIYQDRHHLSGSCPSGVYRWWMRQLTLCLTSLALEDRSLAVSNLSPPVTIMIHGRHPNTRGPSE